MTIKIEMIGVHDLIPYKNNAKKHSEKQVQAIANSISKFGFNQPIAIWSEKNEVVAGHARLLAARHAGLKEVPCVRLDHLSDTERRAYILADNKLSEGQDYDTELLLEELTSLADLDFDINLTGFDLNFLADEILDANPEAKDESTNEYENEDHEVIGDDDRDEYDSEVEDEEQVDLQDLPIPFKVPERVSAGSAWRLGSHLLVCGNSSDASLVLRFIKENSAQSIVTDPPYGISFMGKEWDHGVPSAELWKVWISRVSPGAHILSFCATRMYHHMAMNIENAGFDPCDMISWMYGTGFPKSQDISKAIDKAAGHWRGKAGEKVSSNGSMTGGNYERTDKGEPLTTAAKRWSGWGTALKPSQEPIMLAQKPIAEKTIAKNVQKFGTGALNIDGSRIGSNPGYSYPNGAGGSGVGVDGTRTAPVESTKGRWPANTILSHAEGCVEVGVKSVGTGDLKKSGTRDLDGPSNSMNSFNQKVKYAPDNYGTETVEAWECVDGCPVKLLDEQSGVSKPKAARTGKMGGQGGNVKVTGGDKDTIGYWPEDQGGGASRFFYVAKPSPSDKNEGNDHATVKPIRLMEYLIRMITPQGGTVLEPFAGSGTTLLAAEKLHMKCIAFELDPHHCDIIIARWEQMTGRTAEAYVE